ncbi:MAG: hypothetical protein ACREXP_21210, partial [Steroidobacteraceae bacterium]
LAYDGQNAVQSRSLLNIRKQLDALASKMKDPRLKFLFDPGPWSPDADHKASQDLDTLLASWLGDGSESSRPITILDLSGIPASVLMDLPRFGGRALLQISAVVRGDIPPL